MLKSILKSAFKNIEMIDCDGTFRSEFLHTKSCDLLSASNFFADSECKSHQNYNWHMAFWL